MAAMSTHEITPAKRSGLDVDLDRLSRDGDAWLTPEDRYALKTLGVCAQKQAGVFMIRVRIPGGLLPRRSAAALAAIADQFGRGWLHLTTRQNMELHHVGAREVPAVLGAIADAELSTGSTCGHTVRNVTACPDAGVTLDEPFDCRPDARLVSDAVLARSRELNRRLPSRLNVAFGGCDSCREHAKLNDLAFVSTIRDGVAGYEVWAGGGLGTAPALAFRVRDFLPRGKVVAAALALIEVFVRHGDLDSPRKARLKTVVERLGQRGFREAFDRACSTALGGPLPAVRALNPEPPADLAALLASVPAGGWGPGVRPQRTPGLVSATIRVPLGDLDGSDLRLLSSVATDLGDGVLHLTRNQNVVLHDVPLTGVSALRSRLAARDLGLEGADSSGDVRACTGATVCALGITDAPSVALRLEGGVALSRNSALRVHVSGCPSSCAQHQAGDVGLSGAKVRVGGRARLGFQVWLGADVARGVVGEVVGRVAEDDVPHAVEAVIGVWEALRHRGERMADTFHRVGPEAFAAHVAALAEELFEPGEETHPTAVLAAT